MKGILFMKVIGMSVQIISFLATIGYDAIHGFCSFNTLISSYILLGIIQPTSCLVNLLFLRRAVRSPFRIMYELLLLGFGVMAYCDNVDWDFHTNIMVLFCGGMALGYALISMHELRIIWRLWVAEDINNKDRSNR